MIRISDLISRLAQIKEIHGDLECYYAIDDEGNRYCRVNFDADSIYLDEDNKIGSPTSAEEAKNFRLVCCIN